jgi:A/G-specific adenine glycosylase
MSGNPQQFVRRLLSWYRRHRRDLPWRVVGKTATAAAQGSPDPYHVLVSEAMLQQTQVATVVPYFRRFLERFPTVRALAESDQQDVLRLWQGLGYYSRARNLRRAAQRIVAEHGGQVPREVEQLRALPGVGRYTAGAVASIAYGVRAPIVDGNVARVLCRLDKIASDPREPTTQQLLWRRAEEILPRRHVGDFNSALMELGATVCIPRSPQCLICPVREFCEARAAGVQDQIPPPRKTQPTPLLRRRTFCVRRARDGRWLIEQRPATGRWAGMWQFVTVEAGTRAVTTRSVALACDVRGIARPRKIAIVTHVLTHRRYEFDVYVTESSDGDAAAGAAGAGGARPGVWCSLEELSNYPLPRPHLKIAQLLRELRESIPSPE